MIPFPAGPRWTNRSAGVLAVMVLSGVALPRSVLAQSSSVPSFTRIAAVCTSTDGIWTIDPAKLATELVGQFGLGSAAAEAVKAANADIDQHTEQAYARLNEAAKALTASAPAERNQRADDLANAMKAYNAQHAQPKTTPDAVNRAIIGYALSLSAQAKGTRPPALKALPVSDDDLKSVAKDIGTYLETTMISPVNHQSDLAVAFYDPGNATIGRRPLASVFSANYHTAYCIDSYKNQPAGTASPQAAVKKSATSTVQASADDHAPIGALPGQPQPSRLSQYANRVEDNASSGLGLLRARAYPAEMFSAADFDNPAKDITSDPAHSEDGYLKSASASLQLGQTTVNSKQSNSLIGTVGFEAISPLAKALGGDTSLAQRINVVPYAAIDRELNTSTSSSSKTPPAKYATNLWDYGVVVAVRLQAGTPREGLDSYWADKDQWSHIVSARFDNLNDAVNKNTLLTTELRYTPITPDTALVPVNQLASGQAPGLADICKTWLLQCTMIFDLRAKIGNYGMNGAHPSGFDLRLAKDFERVGGRVGPYVEIDLFPSYPITLSYTYTNYLAPAGFHKSLALQEAAAQVSFGPKKALSVSANYTNGRRDDTAARYDSWSVNLGLSY